MEQILLDPVEGGIITEIDNSGKAVVEEEEEEEEEVGQANRISNHELNENCHQHLWRSQEQQAKSLIFLNPKRQDSRNPWLPANSNSL